MLFFIMKYYFLLCKYLKEYVYNFIKIIQNFIKLLYKKKDKNIFTGFFFFYFKELFFENRNFFSILGLLFILFYYYKNEYYFRYIFMFIIFLIIIFYSIIINKLKEDKYQNALKLFFKENKYINNIGLAIYK